MKLVFQRAMTTPNLGYQIEIDNKTDSELDVLNGIMYAEKIVGIFKKKFR